MAKKVEDSIFEHDDNDLSGYDNLDDILMSNEQNEGSHVDVLDSILNQDDHKSDGPPIYEAVAKKVAQLIHDEVNKETIEHVKSRIQTPSNCAAIVVPKVNPELWSQMNPPTKTADIKSQNFQILMSKSMTCFATIASEIAKRSADLPKEFCEKTIRLCMDGVTMQSLAMRDVNFKRRQAIKPHLSQQTIKGIKINVKRNEAINFAAFFHLRTWQGSFKLPRPGPLPSRQIQQLPTRQGQVHTPVSPATPNSLPTESLNKVQTGYAGRISHYISEWNNITKNREVLEIVQGYRLPFKVVPQQSNEPKQLEMSETDKKIIEAKISELSLIGAIEKVERVLTYTCLPFGLSCAPRVFTKLMKPVVETLRSQGHLSVIYLDDLLLLGKDELQCRKNIFATKQLLNKLGLLVSEEKSKLSPSQEIQYLGFKFNSCTKTMELPMGKRQKVLNLCSAALHSSTMTIMSAAELIGYLVSVSPAVPYSPLYIRTLELEKTIALVKNNYDYSKFLSFSDSVRKDLKWWVDTVGSAVMKIRNDSFDFVVFTDASLTGWGAHCNNVKTHGFWSEEQTKRHINELELMAILYGLQTFVKEDSVNVLIRSDSTTAISYINKYGGCRSVKCHKIASTIWKWCESKNIWLFASYISTDQNVVADVCSRVQVDGCEFKLSKQIFDSICLKFFKPKIDLFASIATRQCMQYYSWYPDPESIGNSKKVCYRQCKWDCCGTTLAGAAVVSNNSPFVEKSSACSGPRITETLRAQKLPQNLGFQPSSVSINVILGFLTDLYENGSSYSSMNAARSALSVLLGKVDGVSIGEHPLVVRLLRGVGRLRPPLPRYQTTWDVLSFFETMRSPGVDAWLGGRDTC
ncbi:Transposon Ty3-I Gag-Pol polyprotein [Orchesella cincta]|uniref:Transposon Ty3-I Gag-Pol polyprotein n=1 Tax=Orchesella cincta TaxID=48709 RepID=A0A1D2MC99_ORCCI|nr:Transposon Ty3-I Gag-Pol polyprotein [Orchesella cincta]